MPAILCVALSTPAAAATVSDGQVRFLNDMLSLETLCDYRLDRDSVTRLLSQRVSVGARQIGPGGSLRVRLASEVARVKERTASPEGRKSYCAELAWTNVIYIDWTATDPGFIPAPVAVDAALSRAHTRRVQTLLARLGFDPGSADGIAGARTQEAIRAFERKHGLTRDPGADLVNTALLRALESRARVIALRQL